MDILHLLPIFGLAQYRGLLRGDPRTHSQECFKCEWLPPPTDLFTLLFAPSQGVFEKRRKGQNWTLITRTHVVVLQLLALAEMSQVLEDGVD